MSTFFVFYHILHVANYTCVKYLFNGSVVYQKWLISVYIYWSYVKTQYSRVHLFLKCTVAALMVVTEM